MSLPIANVEKVFAPKPVVTTTTTTKNTFYEQVNNQAPTSYTTTTTTTTTDDGFGPIQSIKENANILIQKLQQDIPNVRTYKLEFFILFLFFIVLFCVFLYHRYRYVFVFRPYTNCEGHYGLYINGPASSSGRSPIPSDLLPMPAGNASDYVYTMWLNVGNWYKNYGFWKHVYHHGSETKASCTDSLSWDSIQTQSPGIWMGPKVNDLRIVVSTQFVVPTSCSAETLQTLKQYTVDKFVDYNEYFDDAPPPAGKCSNEIAMSDKAWTNVTTDTLQQFIKNNPDKYAQCTYVVQPGTPAQNADSKYTMIRLLEYVDIVNFPVGEWFQLSVVVNSNRVEVYMNGMLMRSQVLLGTPVISPSAGYLGLGGSYSGQISKFNYYPRDMPVHVIRYLYKTEAEDPLYRYATNSNYYW